ncbi:MULTISPECIES: hypothetical protein [unclassified Bradyrhizobium]
MAALLARRRLGTPDAKSVDELAQVEQITEPADIVDNVIGIDRRRASKRLNLPIGSARRNQRPTAIRQNCEEIVDAAPPNGVDHGQRLTFKGVTRAGDRHRSRNIMAMGSLWPLPSTPSTTHTCADSSTSESRTVSSGR